PTPGSGLAARPATSATHPATAPAPAAQPGSRPGPSRSASGPATPPARATGARGRSPSRLHPQIYAHGPVVHGERKVVGRDPPPQALTVTDHLDRVIQVDARVR